MRKIHVDDIVATLRQLCIDANIEIRPDTVKLITGLWSWRSRRPDARCSSS